MNIVLRLICESLRRIAVKISFLWGHKHGVYAAASFATSVTSWYSHNGIQDFISVIVFMNIICIAQWPYGANFEILPYNGALARRHKHFKPERTFKQTRVDFVYRVNMTSYLNYVTATLRALFAWRGSYNVRCLYRGQSVRDDDGGPSRAWILYRHACISIF